MAEANHPGSITLTISGLHTKREFHSVSCTVHLRVDAMRASCQVIILVMTMTVPFHNLTQHGACLQRDYCTCPHGTFAN